MVEYQSAIKYGYVINILKPVSTYHQYCKCFILHARQVKKSCSNCTDDRRASNLPINNLAAVYTYLKEQYTLIKQTLKLHGILVLYLCISSQISKSERFFLAILKAI